MLVINRKVNEKFTITNTHTGEKMVFDVPRIDGSHVRIAIDAPRHYHIQRDDCIVTTPRGHDGHSL